MSDCTVRPGGIQVLRKWSHAESRYHPYRIPASWRVSKYEADYGKAVNCAGCGRELPWGETYTSMTVHDAAGIGYGVCESCYDAEVAERRRARESGGRR